MTTIQVRNILVLSLDEEEVAQISENGTIPCVSFTTPERAMSYLEIYKDAEFVVLDIHLLQDIPPKTAEDMAQRRVPRAKVIFLLRDKEELSVLHPNAMYRIKSAVT